MKGYLLSGSKERLMMDAQNLFSLSLLSGGFIVMGISIGLKLFCVLVAYRAMRALERLAGAAEKSKGGVDRE